MKTRSFARRRVTEHRDTFDADNIRDFVDLYLQAERDTPTDTSYTGQSRPLTRPTPVSHAR